MMHEREARQQPSPSNLADKRRAEPNDNTRPESTDQRRREPPQAANAEPAIQKIAPAEERSRPAIEEQPPSDQWAQNTEALVAAPSISAEPESNAPELQPASPANDARSAPKKVAGKRTRMFAPFEWNIASRYLRARRKEGFISVIAGFSLVGIALGVATLIIVMSVMTGFRETLIEKIVGGNPHIQVTTQVDPLRNYEDLTRRVLAVDGVEKAWPSVEGQVLASTQYGHTGVILRGVRKEDLQRLAIVTEPINSSGSLDAFEGDRGIALGDGAARTLGIRLGDTLTLLTPDGDLTPFGPTPRSKSYPVVYIYRLGQPAIDSAYVYMPLQEAQFYLNKKRLDEETRETYFEADAINAEVSDPNIANDHGSTRMARLSGRSMSNAM